MTLPNLIHPIQITVERLLRSELLMDEDAREPVIGARTTTAQTFTMPAQIKWSNKDDPDPMEAGPRERDSGYVLLRLHDMDAIMGVGQRLTRGDRIITMGVTTGLDLYITGQEPIGHWPDQLGQTMIKYKFSDRHPVRQLGDL